MIEKCIFCGKECEGYFIQDLFNPENIEDVDTYYFCDAIEMTIWRKQNVPNSLTEGELKFLKDYKPTPRDIGKNHG